MKTPFKYFPLLFILTLFFACSDSDDETGRDREKEDEPKELKLSVNTTETGFLTTDKVDFEFEILEGNGGYVATVSEFHGDPDAIVTIDGNKVIVNLLVGEHQGAEITITDKRNKEATVFIESTHESLNIPNYGVHLDVGQTCIMDNIDFGAGAPYTVEKIRGNASNVVIEDGNIKVTSLALGDTYYKVRDKRGSVANLVAKTTLQFDMAMTNNYLEFDGTNNLSASITLEWGDKWQIIGSTDKVTEDLSVVIPIGSKTGYYVLFIHTTDKGTGTDTITLKDKDGNLAVVKVRVR